MKMKMTISINGEGKPKIALKNDSGELIPISSAVGEYILVPIQVQPGDAGPVKWDWSNKIGHRSRQPRCLIVRANGEMAWFSGTEASIEGFVKILGSSYHKQGKWSSTLYRCLSPAGTIVISWMQDWENGKSFLQDTWEEAFAWVVEKAPQASFESFERAIREGLPNYADKWDENRLALRTW